MSTLFADYAGLFLAAVAFEAAYVAWARSAARARPGSTSIWAVIVAALGLLGLRGALSLPLGWVPYLAGVGVGAYVSARLGKVAPD